MKSILQDLQADLRSFLTSPASHLLIISCETEHSALMLKSIDAFEQDPAMPEIFLIFSHSFENQSTYVEGILTNIREQVKQINEELAKSGDRLLTEPPIEVEDQSLLPPGKLLRILQHVRNLVPKDRRIVWIFYPLEIIDPPRYWQLIEYLLSQLEKSSLHGVKLIARDGDASPVIAERLKGHPRTRLYRPKLDPDSFEKLLKAKANDPQIPADERAQMHMMLAGYDVAHRRFDLALARNRELLGYFAYAKQPHNQSIVLNNIGDLYYIQKKWPEAQGWYERAVVMSVGLKSQPLVLYQCMNLGNALLMQNKFAESLIYYRAGEKLAESNGTIIQQIQALERIGLACYEDRQLEEAAEAWRKAAGLNRKIKNVEGEQADLEQLCQIYSEMGDKKKVRECKSMLAKLTVSEDGVRV
jgi:tetratricopeptide (TPR) repeat protein